MTAGFSLQEAVRPNIWTLKPYRCARDDFSSGILLDANENSLGSSLLRDDSSGEAAKLGTAAQSALHLNRYPDPLQISVKEKIVALRGLPSTEHVFLGVGSDEVIDLVLRVFGVPGRDKVLITPPTYGMYSVTAQVNDLDVVKVPLNLEDGTFQLQTAKVIDAVSQDPNIKVIFLCSPGNPTGSAIRLCDIRAILEESGFRGVVVVDEAYIDFLGSGDEFGSVATWVTQYPNLIVMQTLSKAFGLAGIRLGMAFADSGIIAIMNKTKAPYNVSATTAAIASAALAEQSVAEARRKIDILKAERARLKKELAALPMVAGFRGLDHANFLLCVIGSPAGKGSLQSRSDSELAEKIYLQLANEHGVVVRFRGREPGCDGCLRITIGSRQENDALLQALRGLDQL